MKKIALLGSTGSIGTQTLDVCSHLKDIQVIALTGNNNIPLLRQQIKTYSPQYVSVTEPEYQKILQQEFPEIVILSGEQGLVQCATLKEIEGVVVATNGFSGVAPTIEAIKSHKTIYLANKEVLVAAGELVMQLVKQHAGKIIPIDSEHSSLFQLINQVPVEQINELILTASGGPFRGYSSKQLEEVTLEDALSHPTWNMGSFISVNSSTLMNKAFELIEAYWLFNVPVEKIRVVVHPQSIIHGALQLNDGSFFAHLGPKDMRIAIQYALTYPQRHPTQAQKLSLEQMGSLTFEALDTENFISLELIKECIAKGQGRSCFLNALNEELVSQFLNQKISWNTIQVKLKKMLSTFTGKQMNTLTELQEIDALGRTAAQKKIQF